MSVEILFHRSVITKCVVCSLQSAVCSLQMSDTASFVINLLNHKTIILLNLAEYRLILAARRLSIRRYSARFRRIIVNYLPPSNSGENGAGLHPWQVKKSSKLIVCIVSYLTVLV